jgi:SAM-dependent methyltransferase
MDATNKHYCTACGGEMAPWLHMPIDPIKNSPTEHSEIMQCRSCELGAITPQPDASEIPSFYVLESYYTHGSGHIKPVPATFADRVLTKFAYLNDRPKEFVAEDIARRLPAGGRVCDLGCGHANYLKAFKALGFDVTGVDPDPAAQAHAAENGIIVQAGTAEDVPDSLADGSFDLVIMTHSLEHCRDARRAVENAFRLTRPGGLCYIEVPNCGATHFQTFTVCSAMHDSPRHIHFFTPKALRSLIEATGFVVKESFYNGYVRDFDPSWRAWEATISDRIKAHDPSLSPVRHSFGASVALFLRTFLQPPEEKYDSIGLLVSRPPV